MSYFCYDKNKSLVNFSNSILRHYNVQTFHDSLEEIDLLLQQKPYKKIVCLLLDGLGVYIKDKHLSPNDILIKKDYTTITSVFPPTTVAATTSFLTGKYPCETGWLGWDLYYPDMNIVLDMFSGRKTYDQDHFVSPNPAKEKFPTTSIITLLNQNGINAEAIYPYGVENGTAKDVNEFFNMISQKLKGEDEKFIYAYYPNPDGLIHIDGVDSENVHNCVKMLNKLVAKTAKNNKDTLFLVFADHALVDTSFYIIEDYPDIVNCLKGETFLDSRSCFFRVKEEKKNDFVNLFQKYFGNDFVLFTKEEVIKKEMFGYGNIHENFTNYLGDFLATSISNKGFSYSKQSHSKEPMVAAHAGSLKEESLISIAAINK